MISYASFSQEPLAVCLIVCLKVSRANENFVLHTAFVFSSSAFAPKDLKVASFVSTLLVKLQYKILSLYYIMYINTLYIHYISYY